MSYGGNRVSALPSAMEFVAEHYVGKPQEARTGRVFMQKGDDANLEAIEVVITSVLHDS